MKILITLFVSMILSILFLISACAPSEKKDSITNTETTSQVEKPSIDLQTAVVTGNLAVVEQHIKAGTDINAKDAMSGSTPLITAATFNQAAIAKALIDARADLSLKNNDGATALHTAAFFGRIEIVQLLIDAKADKTLKNNFGATPRETVLADFKELEPFYNMLIQQLEPMGFQLDLEELQKARPVIAVMLQ